MRVMVMVKATTNSEAGVMPRKELFEKMIAYNEELTRAGIMKSGDGLKPSKFGKRVVFRTNGKKSMTDGPFAETKELIAGYFLWEVKSMDEAMDWAQRMPHPMNGEETNIELRLFWEPEDFGEVMTPEMNQKIDDMHRTFDTKQ